MRTGLVYYSWTYTQDRKRNIISSYPHFTGGKLRHRKIFTFTLCLGKSANMVHFWAFSECPSCNFSLVGMQKTVYSTSSFWICMNVPHECLSDIPTKCILTARLFCPFCRLVCYYSEWKVQVVMTQHYQYSVATCWWYFIPIKCPDRITESYR